jgi:hypothetical protein
MKFDVHYIRRNKCRQTSSAAAVLDRLHAAGLDVFVSDVHPSGSGVLFTIRDRDGLLAALEADPRFCHDTPFGALHAAAIGAGLFTVKDFRSYTAGEHTLGVDTEGEDRGITRSLQVCVGPTVNGTATGYADLDCDNPAQDLPSLVRHTETLLFGENYAL